MATRIQQLAQPKPNPLRHPDRRSVYWLDKLPPEKNGFTTKIELTPRWLELSRNKKFYTQLSFPFSFLFSLMFCLCFYPSLSPIWEVSERALRAVPSERLCRLARPRAPVAAWQPDRPLLAPLNRGTQTAVASSRICQLAQPKKRPVQRGPGHRPKPVPVSHMPCKASAHIELLATPKHEHPKYEGERTVSWPVSRSARSAVASQRVLELSSPKERKALYEGYDPYTVSRAARSAGPSSRIRQLSLPLPRKCSSE
ncbi:sperm microtubule associated protein 2 [Sphaeramia orbicularis]|uniref:sperm microtubule associated protein 2 n=1 Tax=Sphaeramia orbicularis TaxID=375764 RepID=UPI00117CEBE3|nr:testicular haploid expressed gene protein-like [Sphaeramia orbicularis]